MKEEVLKYILMGSYVILEHLLGKTKFGSTIGLVLSLIFKKKGF